MSRGDPLNQPVTKSEEVEEQKTLFLTAVSHSACAVMRFLFDRNNNVIQDKTALTQNTALHIACQAKQLDAYLLLLTEFNMKAETNAEGMMPEDYMDEEWQKDTRTRIGSNGRRLFAELVNQSLSKAQLQDMTIATSDELFLRYTYDMIENLWPSQWRERIEGSRCNGKGTSEE